MKTVPDWNEKRLNIVTGFRVKQKNDTAEAMESKRKYNQKRRNERKLKKELKNQLLHKLHQLQL